jgi:hypothetical protein
MNKMELLKLAQDALKGAGNASTRDAYVNVEAAIELLNQWVEVYLNEKEIKPVKIEDVNQIMLS